MENLAKNRKMKHLDKINATCSKFCKSVLHGNEITSTIRYSNESDSELCSILIDICSCCESSKDSNGRTPLHIAALCSRIDLVRWLINVRNADINIKDIESGSTPLIYALNCGNINIAVELIKLGANVSITNAEDFTAFSLVLSDTRLSNISNGLVYAWGLNRNNSLGLFGVKEIPEYLDIFHKEFRDDLLPHTVQQVCLSKFHSIMVNTDGSVYSCGHGFGGRLGLGCETTVVKHTKINFPSNDTIVKAAVGRDHSIFLSLNHIYSVGYNKYKVLGVDRAPEKATSPIIVEAPIANIEGICAGNYHSLVWNSAFLFVWGLNVGQFGPTTKQTYYINTPRKIQNKDIASHGIKKVACSDGAIGVLTKNRSILIFHEYLCKKIASTFTEAEDIYMVGGNINTKLEEDMKNHQIYELKVLVRTCDGELFLWRQTDQTLCKCVFSLPRDTFINNAFINANELLFVTNIGEAYKGSVRSRNVATPDGRNRSKSVEKPVVNVDLQKIPRIQRAVSIISDTKGEDFCIIQQIAHSRNDGMISPEYPEREIQKNIKTLLIESCIEDDIHDVKIKIGDQIFPCHKYIIAHGSKGLKKMLNNCKDNLLVLNDISAETFSEMRTFIYTRTCDLFIVNDKSSDFLKYLVGDKSLKTEKLNQNPLYQLLKAAEKYKCGLLFDILSNVDRFEDQLMNTKFPMEEKTRPNFLVARYPQFYDVEFKCNDNVKLSAHKCILAARMEFFKIKFSRWGTSNSEICTIDFPYNQHVGRALLKYLYEDSGAFLYQNQDCDLLSQLLIASDEYLLLPLKKYCESLLSINLDFKNAVNLLKISCAYNAPLLMKLTIEFILHNIIYFLEMHALDDLDDCILEKLTKEYTSKPHVFKRTIQVNFSTRDNSEAGTSGIGNTRSKKIKIFNEPNKKMLVEDDENEIESSDSPNVSNSTESSVEVDDQSTRLSSPDEFPSLNRRPPRLRTFSETSSSVRLDNRNRMFRLSQKERRRLRSESDEKTSSNAETPKNPWKTLPPLSTIEDIPSTYETAFSEIVQSEKRLKENLTRITNKSLICTQLEDKAILDLEKFYNVLNIEDEVIVIERVDMGKIACPTWVPHKQRYSNPYS